MYTTGAGPNAQLQASDFPLTRLAVAGARGGLDPSADSNDAVSSQGVHHLAEEPDPLGFSVGSLNTRRVEPRNSPTVINAVFNHRQFWDGRAEDVFNGVNHLGQRDLSARVYRAVDPRWPLSVRVELINSSLASQAVAPVTSTLEMAEPGRTIEQVGAELADAAQDLQAHSAAPSPVRPAGAPDRQPAWLSQPLAPERTDLSKLR